MNRADQFVSEKIPNRKFSPLLCRICGQPLAVEACKTDDGGKAIHEDCYVLKLKLEQASKDAHES